MRLSTISKLALLSTGAGALLDLGTRIRRLRLEAGLTQVQVAGPFTAAYVSAIERGKVVPSLAALVLLAHGLGVPPSDLLAEVNFITPAEYTRGHAETSTSQPAGRTGVRHRFPGSPQSRTPSGGPDPVPAR